MSALTKFFVVLLVLLSILQTAGMVVFVNKTEALDTNLEAAKQQVLIVQKAAEDAKTESANARQTAIATQSAAAEQLRAKDQSLTAAQRQVADKDTTIAEVQGEKIRSAADLSKTTEALKASIASNDLLQADVKTARTTLNDLNSKNVELNLSLTDYANKLEVTDKALRYAEEQLTQAQSQNTQLNQLLKDNGVSKPEVASLVGTRGGAPAINGVVRDVRDIGGITYATISVGAADDVKKGMEFKVVDRINGNFLGIITIETIEPNEATGKLDGPRVAEIRAGNEVRTQL